MIFRYPFFLLLLPALLTPSLSLRNFLYTSVFTETHGATCSPSSSTPDSLSTCGLMHYAYFYGTRAIHPTAGEDTKASACFKPCNTFRAMCGRACRAAVGTTKKRSCMRLFKKTPLLAQQCDRECVTQRYNCFKRCWLSVTQAKTCPLVIRFEHDWFVTTTGTCQKSKRKVGVKGTKKPCGMTPMTMTTPLPGGNENSTME